MAYTYVCHFLSPHQLLSLVSAVNVLLAVVESGAADDADADAEVAQTDDVVVVVAVRESDAAVVAARPFYLPIQNVG